MLLDEICGRKEVSEIWKPGIGSCFDLKLGPNISYVRASPSGTIKKQLQGGEVDREGKAANIRGINFPKRHFIKK